MPFTRRSHGNIQDRSRNKTKATSMNQLTLFSRSDTASLSFSDDTNWSTSFSIQEEESKDSDAEICQLANRNSKPDVLSLYPNARCVNLTANKLDSLTVVPKNICTLILSQNVLTDLCDLNTLTGLQYLDVSQNKLRTLKGIHQNTQLETLVARDNVIQIVQGLENLKNLETLNLDNNKISNISAVRTLSCNRNLQHLSLSGNPIYARVNVRQRMMDMIPGLKYFDEKKLSPSPQVTRRQIAKAELKKEGDNSYVGIYKDRKRVDENQLKNCGLVKAKDGFIAVPPVERQTLKVAEAQVKSCPQSNARKVNPRKYAVRRPKTKRENKNAWGESRTFSHTITSLTESTVKEIRSGKRFSYLDIEDDNESILTTRDDEFNESEARKIVASKLHFQKFGEDEPDDMPLICDSPRNNYCHDPWSEDDGKHIDTNKRFELDSPRSSNYIDQIEALIHRKQMSLKALKSQLSKHNLY